MAFVIATRGSALALWQAHHVANALRAAHPSLEVVVQEFVTRGDKILDRPLPEIGGKGLFTAELEAALRAGEVSVAVHSLKDLPTEEPGGLGVIAVPRRADPRDALVLDGPHRGAVGEGSLDGVPQGGVLGTSSLRRQAQARRLRPDLTVRSIRGNVGTRLRKLAEEDYDAVLLACAGLDRLDLGARIDVRLDRPWHGAAGQGAIAVQGRTDDEEVRGLVSAIHHPDSALEVEAERAVLAGLAGGCSTPLGVSGVVAGGQLSVSAVLLTPTGDQALEAQSSGPATPAGRDAVVASVLADLRAQGADALVAALE